MFEDDLRRFGICHRGDGASTSRRVGVLFHHYLRSCSRYSAVNASHCQTVVFIAANWAFHTATFGTFPKTDEKLTTFHARHLRLDNYGKIAISHRVPANVSLSCPCPCCSTRASFVGKKADDVYDMLSLRYNGVASHMRSMMHTCAARSGMKDTSQNQLAPLLC